ncbi:MAG: HDOD domain-containing protein [Desulfobacteraceae bacterium]|nr:HDOD domain-containing protein [Desulfobacteraceae bacterium]
MEIKEKILKMIKEKESDLPTLPIVINKILSIASDTQSTVRELEKVISYDQAMTSKLLKLSNSMYYAQKTKVETIKRAITVIGFDEIIGIAIGMKVLSTFKDESGVDLDMSGLWIHCIGVATASKELAKRTNSVPPSKIFIPALLHDMGKVIFTIYFKNEYKEIQKLALETKKPLYLAENVVLKVNHALLSALLMKRWDFPESIIMPCRFHHNPDAADVDFQPQSFIIHMADYAAQKAGIGHSGNMAPTLSKNSFKLTGINQSKLDLVIDMLRRNKEEIQEFFEMTTEA